MARRDYLDFDLLVEPEGDGQFAARVTNSPAGEATTLFRLPFNELEIENFLLRFSRARGTVRRIDSPELEAARKFGSGLFGAVFVGDVLNAYLLSRANAETSGKGLRIRLRLTEAPSLVDLPWELLYDPGVKRDFVALSDQTPVVRYPQMPSPVKPLLVTPPLRILMVVSSPSDYEQLDVEGEERLLREALDNLITKGVVEVELLKPATLSALHQRLDRSEVHVLHYIGHGGYETSGQEGVLVMVGEQGRGRKVEASRLGTILNDHEALRLVVLNACEGSRSGTEDPFSGVASEIARRGAPAVIAMQFEITDEAAKAFSHAFYVSIANGSPVDAAVASARKAMFAAGDNIEWATPVLYLRSTNGVIFDLQQQQQQATVATSVPAPKPRSEDSVSDDFDRALEAIGAKSWSEAQSLLRKVLDLAPNHAEAKAQLETATARIRARTLVGEGRTAHAAGRWEEAVAAFSEAAQLDPDFTDEEGLLEDAEWRLNVERQPDEPTVSVEPAPVPSVPTPQTTPATVPARSIPAPRRRRGPGWTVAIALGAAFLLFLVAGVILAILDPDASTTTTAEAPITSAVVTTAGTISTTGAGLPPADVTAVRMSSAPVIDGLDTNEWMFNPQAESVHVVAPIGFAGSAAEFIDAPTATWWIGWDGEALYLFVIATDPNVVQQMWIEPHEVWKGDSSHFEFGPDPQGLGPAAPLRPQDVHVLLGPGISDALPSIAAINRERGGAFVSGDEEPSINLVTVLSLLDPPGYGLEVRVPWEVLNVSNPAIGSVFGMNMNVSDGDGDRGLRVMVSSNPDRIADNQPRPGTWNTLVLGP